MSTPTTGPTSGAEGRTAAEGGRNDPSEANYGTMEVTENGRAPLYRLQGMTSRDTRASGRFVAGDEAARFWSQVDRQDSCWLWSGHRNRDGYGQFKVTVQPGTYRTVRAHRWAWESANGPVPDGLTLDHLCGQTACVRPEHLEPLHQRREPAPPARPPAGRPAEGSHAMTGNELADVRHVAPADLTPSEAQARARAAWRQSGGTLTGAELGERFDRSERWGRQQIAAARAEDTAAATATTAAAPAATPAAGEGMAAPDGAAPAPAAHARHAGDGTAAAPTPTTAAQPAGNRSRRDAVPASGMPPGRTDGSPAAAGPRPGTAPKRATAFRLPSGTPVAERPAHERQGGTVPFPLIATTVAAVVLVTVVCAVVSYGHIRDLALIAGMGSQAAWLPLGVDGLVVASSCAVIVDHQLGRRGQPLAWCGVALGLAGSLAANVLAVDPELVSLRAVRWVLAGYTPAALAVSGHLLFRMLGERQ